MAQNIILKRSAVPGRVPDTGSINLGEVAINTFDGKLYFKKSGSVQSVETIVTTNSITSGSIQVSDDITIQRDLYVVRDVITDGDIDASGSLSGSGLSINDTLNITHNNFQLSGSAAITGSLTVMGAINATQFNISVISSSIIFESGSSKFGNTSDDIHQFTGSVQVTGSLYLNGVDLSQGNNSGSFSGSFQGDGSGLRGVVSDDIPRDGWDYDSNSSASISEFNITSSKYLIDFQWEQELGSPVGYKGFIANTTGSTQIVPTTEGIKFIVENELVATIGVEGIVATLPNGVVSSSAQLTGSYDTRYVLSGSISAVPTGTISGSSQISSLGYAITGSNTFVGTQTLSGSIIPATDNAYDLGSATYQWRDIYVSSGSLYIDGTKVLSSTGNELQITTDVGQSIKILEAGSDSIILQSADGNIELKSSGGGNLLFDPTSGLIDVRGTLQIQDGNKITSSGGNAIQFGNNIAITGSIVSTTTPLVSGSSQIDLTQTTGYSTFSTSVNSRVANFESNSGGYATTSSVNTISASAWGAFQSASSYSGSFYTTINTNIGNINTNSASAAGAFASASSYSSSLATSISASNYNITINSASVSSLSSSFGSRILTIEGKTLVSGSSQIDVMSTTNITRLATTGSNTFVGNQTISGTLYLTGSLIPSGNFVYDLGSETNSFRDLYISTGSIRFHNPDGTEQGRITVDKNSGDISLLKTAGLTNEQKATISQGTINPAFLSAVSASNLFVQNKIVMSAGGTINGINLTTFSSSVANKIGQSLNTTDNVQFNTITANEFHITTISSSVLFTSGSTKFGDTQDDIMSVTGSLKVTGSTNFTELTGSLASFSSSLDSRIGAINVGTLSASIATTDATQTTNITTNSASAWGAFQSASSYSSSFYTTINTNIGNITAASASAWGAFQSASTYSASAAVIDNTQTTNITAASASAWGAFQSASSYSSSFSSRIIIIEGKTLVSGSSQITLSSTTGYGSVLNQAVLTTSTPTFAGITANGHIYATNGSISFGGTSSPPTTDPAIYRVAGNDLVVAIGSSERVRIASTGTSSFSGNVEFANGYKIRMQNPSMMIDALTPSYFGYSTGYGTLIVGHTGNNNRSIAFGVDVSANASGAFTGLGNEYIWRGAASFITPNSSNNGYNTLFSWNSSGQMTFNQNATFSGTITENSSLRYKENVETIKYGLDKVLQMRGVTYNKKDNGVKELGVIAEEIYDVLPEVVLKNEEGEIDSVSYGRITAVLIEAIKDLKKEIEELKANR